MNTKQIVLWIGVLLFFPATSAFPAGASLRLGQVSGAGNGEAEIHLSLVGGAEEPTGFKVTSPLFPSSLAIQSRALPINLWLIVDSAQLCASHHVDETISSQWATLKKKLPAGSRVSLVSFTNSTMELEANQTPVSEMGDIAIHCDGGSLSASYERALTKMMDATLIDPDLPTVAWIYSSGNIQLSKPVVKRLASRQVTSLVILYNPILAQELGPLVDEENDWMGADRIRLVGFDSTNALLSPERWYQIKFGLPADFAGGTVPFAVSALLPSGPVNISGMANQVSPTKPNFWSSWGRQIFFWTGVILLVAAISLIIRYYRVRRCSKCRLRMRVGQKQCLFCLPQGSFEAFLVGAFNVRDRRKMDRLDVLPITGKSFEMGTHRRSRHRLLRLRGTRRQRYFQVVREDRDSELPKYRLMPDTDVWVNGRLQKNVRFLASGDQIESGGWKFTFVTRRGAQ